MSANISGSTADMAGNEKSTVHPVNDLVSAARDGDKAAFGQLYRLYQPRVYRLARFYLGGDAEDAVAETFVRAWSSLPRYRDRGVPFVAWIYGIARHVVADELKRRGRVHPQDVLPDTGKSFDRDGPMVLAAALEKLPKEQRQIVEMKYLLGMKNPEVASLLGKSIGAINAQQWRALKTLKDLLGEAFV